MKHQVTCLPETQDATPALVDTLKAYLRRHPELVEALGGDGRVYDGNVDWQADEPGIVLFHSSQSRPAATAPYKQYTDLVFVVKHADQRRTREIAHILIDAVHGVESRIELRPPAQLCDAYYHGHRVFPAGGDPMDVNTPPLTHYRAWIEFNFYLAMTRGHDKLVEVAAGPRTGSGA